MMKQAIIKMYFVDEACDTNLFDNKGHIIVGSEGV